MNTFWQTSTFFGIFITLFFYGVGMFLKQKVKHTLVIYDFVPACFRN